MKLSKDMLLKYAADLLHRIGYIEDFTHDGYEAFTSEVMRHEAVMRSYEVIGEIVKRLPDSILLEYPQVNRKKIKGFRDFLIHNYDEVNLGYVWDAVLDLPNIKAAVLAVQKSLPDED